MATFPSIALSTGALWLVGVGSAQSSEDRFEKAVYESTGGGSLPYRLFRPAPAREGAKHPLVLFLHGAGERGTNNRAQLRNGVREFVSVRNQAVRPCFVVAPQCPRGKWWDPDLLLEFAEAMRDALPVDADRFYVTGLSMGGYATWYLIGRRPELFAAAVPICGGGEPEAAAKLADFPVWAFHGSADRTVAPRESRKMIAAIQAAGGRPRYKEYPGVRHDSWTRTYADPAVHEWLFEQRRSQRDPAAVALRDGDRVVFFGDSITFAGARDGGYIKLVEADLRRRQPGDEVELIGAGISGHKVPDLQERLERDVLSAKPTVVVIYIGINDVWHSTRDEGTDKDDFEAGLRDLVARIGEAKARVILCTPSVIGEKVDGTNPLDAMLEDYSAITRAVAASTGAQVLDLRRRFLDHLDQHNTDNVDRGILTRDTVHLSPAGQRFVADRMLEALRVPPAKK